MPSPCNPFYEALQKRGYTIKRGANVTHTAIKPPGSDRFFRLDSLGEGYTEANIRARLNKKPLRAGEAEATGHSSLVYSKRPL